MELRSPALQADSLLSETPGKPIFQKWQAAFYKSSEMRAKNPELCLMVFFKMCIVSRGFPLTDDSVLGNSWNFLVWHVDIGEHFGFRWLISHCVMKSLFLILRPPPQAYLSTPRKLLVAQLCMRLCDPRGPYVAHQALLSMGFSRQECLT